MLIENNFINSFAKYFPRSGKQLNSLNESDAELIRVNDNQVIAISTDNIVEEIEAGLYTDPYHIGWMAVMVNLSDIAAVGANPLGILLTFSIPENTDSDFMHRLQEGINDACNLYKLPVLGGDTNHATYLMIGGTATGIIEDEKIILRTGCAPGDRLYITSKLGLGGAYAYGRYFNTGDNDFTFFPQARVEEGIIIRQYGSSCIDTSDSFFPAISNMMELNKIGFHLDNDINDLISNDILEKLDSTGIPPWFLLAGPHGEFELLFTIPEQHNDEFIEAANKINWNPIQIGRASDSSVVSLTVGNEMWNADEISNMYHRCGGNINSYLNELKKYNHYECQH